MAKNNAGEIFAKAIRDQVSADMRSLNVKIAQFIDQQVIDRKFAEGFPGQTLSPDYVRRKKREGYSEQVGVRTGALRKAATQVTNWQLWQPKIGNLDPIAIKRRHGLAAYADAARTREGPIDFLTPDSDDVVNIQNRLFALLGRNYKRHGAIKVH